MLSPSVNDKVTRSKSFEGVKKVVTKDKVDIRLESKLAEFLPELKMAQPVVAKEEKNEQQYLSPKARYQIREKNVPPLLSSVFLTGMVNPEGVSPKNETTIEHIITEHHEKLEEKKPEKANKLSEST